MTAAQALELIQKYGVAMTVSFYADGSPVDSNKPWILPNPTVTTQSTYGVFLASKHVKYGLSVDEQMDSDGISSKEKRVLLAASGLTSVPNIRCMLTVGGVKWKIVSVIPIRPANTDLVYTLQVRQ